MNGRSTRRGTGWLAPLCLIAVAIGAAQPAAAKEEFQRFLDGLRERGMHDMALEYLDVARESSLVSTEEKQVIPYHEAVVLVESARSERDVKIRTGMLDQARNRLREFIKANSAHPLAASAEIQLGNVLVERGRGLVEQSARPSNASKKEELLGQAREMLGQSQEVFTAAEEKFDTRLKQYRGFINPKDTAKIEAREQARADLLQARLYGAAALYEQAQAWQAGSDEAKKRLQAAADKYGEIYEKHRKLLAGLLARVKQGECYQELGDTKRALGFYAEILAQPDELEEFRRLKATAMHLTLSCLTSQAEKRYDEAIAKGEEWLAKARGAEDRSSDGLAIRYYTALGHKLRAENLKPEEEAQKKPAQVQARKHFNFVSKYPGAFQNEAKQLFRALAGIEAGDVPDPTSFAEARDLGKQALDLWAARSDTIKVSQAAGDREGAEKFAAEAQQAREQADHYFRLALELRDDETPLEDVNLVRYYLCFFHYQAGEHYDAAVLGEFVARHYPESAAARQCAHIAMAAFAETHQAAPAGQKDFDKQKMLEVAELITRQWPGQAETDEAWTILMSIAIGEHQLDKALDYLAKIPVESPRRGEAELKAGQALWGTYLEGVRQAAEEGSDAPNLDEMVQKAREILENGVSRMRSGVDTGASQATPTLAAAALSLGQIYVGSGQPDKAIEMLNDPKIGPMTLVTSKHSAAQESNFSIETYKLALRAYVGTQALDKAEQTMNELEALVNASGNADTAGLLTRIYIALGRELEEQVARLRQEGKGEELAEVSKGFEMFLERISGREMGNTFSSLNWVGETFYSLASGYDAGGPEASPQAGEYYTKALETDQRIVAAAESDGRFAPGESLLTVKLRMARTLRRLGRHKQAIDMLASVLEQKPMLLDAQREAALTYQEWGRVKAGYYALAINGARTVKDKNGKETKLIWGWNRMAHMVQRDPRFSEAFHEARYNVAKARLDQAQQLKGVEKKQALQRAELDVRLTSRLRPDLGGPEWQKKYDRLLRTIQQALGEKPTGLAESRLAGASGGAEAGTGPARIPNQAPAAGSP